MWNIDGGIAFLAEECGATAVTGLDVMGPTPAYEAEHQRRSSAVRFVRGDLHDPGAIAEVGNHDVVWCAGVLYHAPHPVLTLERLRSITRELLILGTATIPEVPGLEGACVFYPALSDTGRQVYEPVDSVLRHGISTPFDPGQEYGNWWWGITPSALRGLLEATGFEVIETLDHHFHRTVLARPVAG